MNSLGLKIIRQDILKQLGSRINVAATRNMRLESQMSKVLTEVSLSSKTSGMFLGQPKPNRNGGINMTRLSTRKKPKGFEGKNEDKS